jgi:predicted MPP superfamily phosphohydrolase
VITSVRQEAGSGASPPASTPGWGVNVANSGPLHNPPGRWSHIRQPTPPAPIEPYDLVHPAVPPGLDGLRLLHISDLHIRRGRPLRPAIRAAAAAMRRTPVDLVLLTGDYADRPGDEASTLLGFRTLAASWRARLGAFGIFGNHDPAPLRPLLAALPDVRWLDGEVADVRIGSESLRLWGASFPEDILAMGIAHGRPTPPALNLALVHHPTEIFPLSQLGIPIALCGHTHGGQVRPVRTFAPHTSSDLPPSMACGILRLGDTLMAVSRGIGNAFVEVRVNCPPQIPLYTLRRGPLPAGAADSLTRVVAW